MRPTLRKYEEPTNVPLLMTAMTMPMTFDRDTERHQRAWTGPILELETQLPPHPMRKERRVQRTP